MLTCFVGDERTASTNYGLWLDTRTTASIETVVESSGSFSSLVSIHREGRYSLAEGPEAVSSYVADWTIAQQQFSSDVSHQTADAEADDRVERSASSVWNKSVSSVGHEEGAESSVGQIVLSCFVLNETFAESQSIASVYSRTLVDDEDQTRTRWTFASDSLHSFARHSAGLVDPSSGQRVLSSYAFDEWTLSSYTRTDDNDQALESASLGYLQPEVPFESSYQRSERYALDCRVHFEGATDESSCQHSMSSYAMDRGESYEQTLTSGFAYRSTAKWLLLGIPVFTNSNVSSVPR